MAATTADVYDMYENLRMHTFIKYLYTIFGQVNALNIYDLTVTV